VGGGERLGGEGKEREMEGKRKGGGEGLTMVPQPLTPSAAYGLTCDLQNSRCALTRRAAVRKLNMCSIRLLFMVTCILYNCCATNSAVYDP